MRRGSIALALLVVPLLGVVATTTLVRSPSTLPEAEAGRAQELGRLVAAQLLAAPAGPLLAGAAQVELELPAGTLLGGYASLRPRRSVEAGRSAVSALALATPHAQVVLTGFDAVTVAPTLHARVRGALDDGVVWVSSASHSHSGPGGCGHGLFERLFLGPLDPVLLETLARAHLDSIARARRELRPAQLLDGSAPARELIVNRTERRAGLDATVDVLALAASDRVLGRLVTHNAHATLVAARDRLEPDYPGVLRRVLATADASPLLFAAGATGSAAAPRLDAADPSAALGRALASVVDGVPLTARPAELSLAWQRAWVTMPPPSIPLLRGLALRSWLSRRVVDESLPVDVVRVGHAILVALPGELSAELTLARRQRAASLGWHLVFSSHNGAYGGYFMPTSRYQAPGPEAALELYGPGAGEVIARFVDGILDDLGVAATNPATGPAP